MKPKTFSKKIHKKNILALDKPYSANRISEFNTKKLSQSTRVTITSKDLCHSLHKAEAKILKGPHENLENYLGAIEQLRSNIQFFSNNKSFKSSDGVVNHANNLLAKAISKLEEEFNQLLSSSSKPVEPDRLFECLPNSMRPSSGSPGYPGDSNAKNPSSNSHSVHQKNSLENSVYTPPTLISPRILPLLHDLEQQMVQSGHQQQLLKIYRCPPKILFYSDGIIHKELKSEKPCQLLISLSNPYQQEMKKTTGAASVGLVFSILVWHSGAAKASQQSEVAWKAKIVDVVCGPPQDKND
ncbi:unnamed protein product [Ilex paraguariensis]|uniref:Uncharacterized protein n=1 Tax=Ilex paraguariensis TaxID=185542 RepID=A0ABC8S0R0_9AQUA